MSAPSVNSTTKYPDWVKNDERWIWNGECHSDRATNANSPSNDLKYKTYSIAFPIFSDPRKCVS